MNRETYLKNLLEAHRSVIEALKHLRDAAAPLEDTPRRKGIEAVAADAEKIAQGLEEHRQEVLRGLWNGED